MPIDAYISNNDWPSCNYLHVFCLHDTMRGLDPRGRKAQFQIDTQNKKHSRYGQDSKDLKNNAKNTR